MSTQQVQFFFKESYSDLKWPDHEQATYLKNYFEPLILNGISPYISNITGTPFIIKYKELYLPGILPGKMSDCYVASPYAQYITYAIEELQEIDSVIAQSFLKILLKCIGVLARISDINNVVYVNNWLLSTNLYPEINENSLKQIKTALKEKYPNKVIIFRSLNEKNNSKLMCDLEKLGASKTLSRQVYITDPFTKEYLKRKDYKKDQRFLQRTELDIKESNFSDEEISFIKYLYDKLYIEKYFELNPQFTFKFFKNAIEKNLFTFRLLLSDESPKATLGYFNRNGQMTTPIFGFDIDAPPREGLYRLISAILMQESEKHQFILNQSSGAPHFKRQRGAVPYIEYNYYFADHVSFKQKFIWKFLSFLVNTLGAYILKKLEL